METIHATYVEFRSHRLVQIGEVVEFALITAKIPQICAILVTKNGGHKHGEEIQVALTARAHSVGHENDKDCTNKWIPDFRLILLLLH